jgi:hypothetical protein
MSVVFALSLLCSGAVKGLEGNWFIIWYVEISDLKVFGYICTLKPTVLSRNVLMLQEFMWVVAI